MAINRFNKTHSQLSNQRRKTSTQVPDWSGLHADVLELILKRLSFIDMLNFQGVCSSWLSIAKTHLSSCSLSHLRAPWLMLPSDKDGNFDSNLENPNGFRAYSFFDLADKKFYKINIKSEQLGWSRCVGSSNGWLLCLDEVKSFYLFNPFLDVSIRPNFFRNGPDITKAILWGDPIRGNKNYGIVAIYGSIQSHIIFSKCGDSKWTDLEVSPAHRGYCDITCSNNYVLALSEMGSVEIWDLSSVFPRRIFDIEASFPVERWEFEKSLGELYSWQLYLVESQDEVLAVIRYIGDFVSYYVEGVDEDDGLDEFIYSYMTKLFHVYKLDFTNEKWEKLESLGNRILFLGGNQSISLSAGDFPEYEGNAIYFMDDCWDRMDEYTEYSSHDSEIFSLGDGSIKPIYDLQNVQPLPFWVTPSSVS